MAKTAFKPAPRTISRRPAADYEGTEQKMLFDWLRLQHPQAYKLAFHVPNGGHRLKAVAAKMKGQGVKAGVSDIVLPMARGGHFGLYIEFKATPPHDSVVSVSQQAFLQGVEMQGYMAIVCRGLQAAMDVINGYLALPTTVVVKA
jgi:hypothetical protein